MKTRVGLIIGAAILVVVVACTSKGRHSSGYSYSGTPSYSAPAVSMEAPAEVEKPPTGKAFPTPQAAMAAVVEIAGKHDKAAVDELFGVGATEVLWSGDEVADKEAAERVKGMIKTAVVFEDRSPEETVAVIGMEKWP